MEILNLTAHVSTDEQKREGVIDLDEEDLQKLQRLLIFESRPSDHIPVQRAREIAKIAARYKVNAAMIGGAPYLMAPLERKLWEKGIQPLYAFSKRISREEKQKDGSVKKVAFFRHEGFVQAVYEHPDKRVGGWVYDRWNEIYTREPDPKGRNVKTVCACGRPITIEVREVRTDISGWDSDHSQHIGSRGPDSVGDLMEVAVCRNCGRPRPVGLLPE